MPPPFQGEDGIQGLPGRDGPQGRRGQRGARGEAGISGNAGVTVSMPSLMAEKESPSPPLPSFSTRRHTLF